LNGASRRAHWEIVALFAAFALLAAARLNGFSLLEPDSPEYLFGAKSLASFHGYREIDRPGEPLHTFRPPGLPLLLVPLSWLVPFSVVGAKLVVLASAIAALFLTMRLAARDGPNGAALAVGMLVATSPYALLHATEVVSEFPYLAVSVAAILTMTAGTRRPSRREIVIASVLLAFLPFLRTIGLALVAAALIACLLDEAKRPFWPAPVVALATTAVWMMRNASAGGPTYFGAIAADFNRLGAAAFAAKSARAAGFYLARFVDVLLPGARPGRPLYERMTIGGTPDLGGLYGLGVAAAVIVVAFAARGAWARRTREGTLIALYAAAFLFVLAIYPPRHERLTWPLIPIVWALVPAGLAAVPRPARLAALAAACGLVAWQGSASLAMARDNLAWARGGDGFYATRIPPIYFADWRAAGAWIAANAPDDAVVLTRHSDAGFTSHRLQESVRFEELAPQAWRSRIAKAHARFLVVPTTLFGKFFPFELLHADPAYAYAVRWTGKDAAVVEVLPNRTGTVTAPAASGADRDACDKALAAEPGRVELATRCAELLAAGGQRDEAIARLSALAARAGADVRIQVALGQQLLEAGRAEPAAATFRSAGELPEAELLESTIARGLAAAEARPAPLARARADMDALRWDDARNELDRASMQAPGSPAGLELAGELASRLGRFDEAILLYRRAGDAGSGRAAARGAALSHALAVEGSLTTATSREIVQAAAFWAGDGAPGRALDLLERASARFGGDPEIASHVADLRRFYGLD